MEVSGIVWSDDVSCERWRCGDIIDIKILMVSVLALVLSLGRFHPDAFLLLG
jgi:hypothetical protein